MRKIPLNISSSDQELLPFQAWPFTSHNTQNQTGWSLINPICFIAIISNAFAD
ncbi:hypothetical protein [Niastella vici]|uniref:hypothetical protein n=1 Tax=Niastella vici TaxID=1703345 RepID=UPI001301A435|nr:hypothetical protein [Niastella vici]